MKITKIGTPQPPKRIELWWIGLEITCPSCATVFELEKGDSEIKPGNFVMPVVSRMPGADDNKFVIIGCPTPGCGRSIVLERDKATDQPCTAA